MDPKPVAIVTDVHYRMSPALIRDLDQAGVSVITCEKESHRDQPASPALGALSRHSSRHVWLPEEGYEQALFELCTETGAQYACKPVLLPVGAATLAAVSEQQAHFGQAAGLLIPTPRQLDLMNDKERVATLAGQLGIPVPTSHSLPRVCQPSDFSGIPMPCVIKPRCGERLGLSAAQRYVIARSADAASEHFNRFSELAGQPPLVQTYLPGSGTGCSVLARDGTVMAAIAHRRIREYPVSGGPSSCCKCVDAGPLLPAVRKLVEATGYSGLAMFEFKEDTAGNAHLLEVNPRIWGTFPLTRVARSGIPLLWFTLAWNAANPERLLPVPDCSPIIGKKMTFTASDLMASMGYARRGQPGKLLSAAADLLNPFVRDGLWEWRDAAPAAAYYRSLLKKEKHS